jgi:hypothetical protein
LTTLKFFAVPETAAAAQRIFTEKSLFQKAGLTAETAGEEVI